MTEALFTLTAWPQHDSTVDTLRLLLTKHWCIFLGIYIHSIMKSEEFNIQKQSKWEHSFQV